MNEPKVIQLKTGKHQQQCWRDRG